MPSPSRLPSALVVWICLAVPGCSRPDPCAQLSTVLQDSSGASRLAVDGWLDQALVGPRGERLPDATRTEACSLILREKDALAGFREKARMDLKPTGTETNQRRNRR